ncbi:MAG: hypothetical protein ABIN89_27480 [Chitinophagaceae bacterium]
MKKRIYSKQNNSLSSYPNDEQMTSLHLIFVYNADNSLFGTITDFAHKILSPASYQWKLCPLTYGNFVI